MTSQQKARIQKRKQNRKPHAGGGTDFIRLGVDFERRYGISYQRQRVLIENGDLPPTIRLSARISGWRTQTLEAFFAAKEAEAVA